VIVCHNVIKIGKHHQAHNSFSLWFEWHYSFSIKDEFTLFIGFLFISYFIVMKPYKFCTIHLFWFILFYDFYIFNHELKLLKLIFVGCWRQKVLVWWQSIKETCYEFHHYRILEGLQVPKVSLRHLKFHIGILTSQVFTT